MPLKLIKHNAKCSRCYDDISDWQTKDEIRFIASCNNCGSYNHRDARYDEMTEAAEAERNRKTEAFYKNGVNVTPYRHARHKLTGLPV